MNNSNLNFFATTAKGMEFLLAQELIALGAEDVKETRAGVTFVGNLEIGYKACLWSRIANRILLVLKTIKANDAEELYRGIQTISWIDHLDVHKTFAVDFQTSKSSIARNNNIIHSHFGALKVKDAIVDQFRNLKDDRPSIDPKNADVRVNVYLVGNEAVVSIDLSGESLHRRGYREESAVAPLKENLAAALLLLSDFDKKDGLAFIDPMCGSGTLPIEAALMKTCTAPGLLRKSFGFMAWLGHQPQLWRRLVKDAERAIIMDKSRLPTIIGYDNDPEAIRIARSNLKKAGLLGVVEFHVRELKDCEAPDAAGILMVNPPYGERIGEVEKLKPLYKQLGDLMKQKFKGFSGYIFTSNPELAKSIGLKTSRRFVLYNGPLECRLLKYDLY